MPFEIKVHLFERKRSPYWQMRYRDPFTGGEVARSTGVRILPKTWHDRRHQNPGQSEVVRRRREAVRSDSKIKARAVADRWAKDMNQGVDPDAAHLTWETFRERYEHERLPGLAERTADNVYAAFNALERHVAPRLLRAVNTDAMSKLQAALRKRRLAEATIKTHIAHLRTALRWAVDIDLLPEMPKVPALPRTTSGSVMKGRPITTEEFERMIKAVEEGLFIAFFKKHPVQSPNRNEMNERERRQAALQRWNETGRRETAAAVAPSWRHLLTGLWLSGLTVR